ncbi:glycosyltransferase family 2 protein [Salarchaeum sp. JOR-1]|uniref:glycosyltransferase family 2 protein n=1 Tax=Salarchaeum sp. JOR-1 TaxID=2599399 RepID=UPI00119880A7|nr:glycosyltransferase family 2 protein [Salarchaeum sp. JOR-1]QDX41028.1 glycosyltransferase family 2 protein [Salarchaeum sp. JOR-1]
MEEPLISFVIPVHNSSDCIGECLEAISNQSYSNKEVIIVDNGSEDETTDIVREKCPSAKLIELEENKGHSEAANIGFESAEGKYIAKLDDDGIIGVGWLRTVVDRIQTSSDDIAAIQPKVVEYKSNGGTVEKFTEGGEIHGMISCGVLYDRKK